MHTVSDISSEISFIRYTYIVPINLTCRLLPILCSAAFLLMVCICVFGTGDQILDVDGVNVNNMTIEQVSEVLKTAPILMTCTVKPANHFKYAAEEPKTQQIEQIKKSSYAEIDIDALAKEAAKSNNEIVKAGYEDDQSSHGSQSFVIVPSDDELDHDEKTGDKFQTNGADEDNVFQSRYVNIPPEQGGKSGSPKKNTVPAGQRNYLELYFDEK